MSRLDKYRTALLANFAEVSDEDLCDMLDTGGTNFASFIVDHGLGPLWHERTARDNFYASRMSAEAVYLAQDIALIEIGSVLDSAEIEFAIIKGAATRLILKENPAVRGCHDIDLLVRPDDRVQATLALVRAGFVATLAAHRISVEISLSRGVINIDLHWRLLQMGRLRRMGAAEMLDRRRKASYWNLGAEDALFVLLVHPAFAKHLAGLEMGLHRVVDIVEWVHTQQSDWQMVLDLLEKNGVRTAAWATLQWVQMLTQSHAPAELNSMLNDTQPGRLRRTWLDFWLRNDLSARMIGVHWVRLLGFSLFLHDTPGDVVRALAGRYRAYRRQAEDLAVFSSIGIK